MPMYMLLYLMVLRRTLQWLRNLAVKSIKWSIPHPSKCNKQRYIICDVCHMVKLARNAFSDMKVLYTSTGESISWEYVLALYRTQQNNILHLGNKLKSKHVKWQKYKMKVRVAAQTFSHSVSAAITFLRNLRPQLHGTG